MQIINRRELNDDGIGFIEQYDFSKANISQESRVQAITTIASVCYQNPKAIGSESLYNRLSLESKGLPSSSFEFVPVLIQCCSEEEGPYSIQYLFNISGSNDYEDLAVIKYGEKLEDGDYLLTNLRALISDVGEKASEFFNTEEECKIIAEYFKVFKSKIDLSTRAQYIRHRVSWQELSRRYVSGKKSGFEFYLSPKLENSNIIGEYNALVNTAVGLYSQAINEGVRPEEARRVLPQSMYTTVWSAWQPKQLDVFFKLRLDSHAQQEIRWLAEAKQELLDV